MDSVLLYLDYSDENTLKLVRWPKMKRCTKSKHHVAQLSLSDAWIWSSVIDRKCGLLKF